jgi:hypothetical protein
MEKEIFLKQSFDKKTLVEVSTKMLLSGRVLIYAIVFITVIFANILSDLQEGFSLDIYMAIPFIPLIILVLWIWYRTKSTVSRNYDKNPRYYNDVTYSFTEDSMTLEGKDFQNKVPWSSFYKIKEKDKWFLVYINRNQAHIIDKAQLNGVTTEDLRGFFRQLPPKVKVSLK